MTWLFLSLLSAFTVATNDNLTKHFFSRLTSLEMGLIRPFLFSALAVACIVLDFLAGIFKSRNFIFGTRG